MKTRDSRSAIREKRDSVILDVWHLCSCCDSLRKVIRLDPNLQEIWDNLETLDNTARWGGSLNNTSGRGGSLNDASWGSWSLNDTSWGSRFLDSASWGGWFLDGASWRSRLFGHYVFSFGLLTVWEWMSMCVCVRREYFAVKKTCIWIVRAYL